MLKKTCRSQIILKIKAIAAFKVQVHPKIAIISSCCCKPIFLFLVTPNEKFRGRLQLKMENFVCVLAFIYMTKAFWQPENDGDVLCVHSMGA